MKDRTRKQDFLNVALELFYEKGYDKTTVNDIIDSLKASKGGFYHYFKSKEEVLEAVADQVISPEIAFAKKIADDSTFDAVRKLNEIINTSLIRRIINIEERKKLTGLFENEGNLKLLRKIAENKMKMLYIPYRNIIEQGIREKSFETAFPGEVAEQLIQLFNSLNSMVTRLAASFPGNPKVIDVIRHKLQAYQESTERILGTGTGTLDLSGAADILEKNGIMQSPGEEKPI